ncbi:MAG: ABC transporter substrate-binding protein [Melioribacteraceae bacterium]|nr:ABC transporter substrate-binding protein [Melioribacteraceae bacterium]MCF8353539.1 ABC transporter substrate-binding protein [Melioribacteraceae bacterium]MCF8392527.1 ABC transporter substrate-binding protein [Melioribacteraceae bacterium]MCF8418458.1 ABC transporter substrate-binding protein [Melioribacteraceae bacterium]
MKTQIHKSISLFILLSFVILSCSDTTKEDKIVVTFWHSFVSNTIPALDKLIDRYESENPGIKINAQYVPSGDPLIHKLITAIQSGTTPDLAWVHSDFLDKLVSSGAIYKMDHFINGINGFTKEELDDFFPQLIQNAKWRDTLYALPMEATTLALLYNKDKFRESGIDPNKPPETWEELKEYSFKLTLDRDNDGKRDQYGFYVPVFPASGPLSIWMLLQWEPFLWQAGGQLLNDNQTEAVFNSDAGVAALNIWKEIYDELKFNSFSITHDMAFISGACAMIMDGPWDLPGFRRITKFDWGIAPLPAGPEKSATYLAGEHFTIFKNSENPEESWRFVKWFTSPETQAQFSIESGYMPVRKSTLELESYKNYLLTDPYLAMFVEQFKIGYARQNIDYHRVEINQAVAGAVENSLLGDVDPREALNKAAERVNEILK